MTTKNLFGKKGALSQVLNDQLLYTGLFWVVLKDLWPY